MGIQSNGNIKPLVLVCCSNAKLKLCANYVTSLSSNQTSTKQKRTFDSWSSEGIPPSTLRTNSLLPADADEGVSRKLD